MFEHEIKLLKDREVDQKNKASGYETLLRDGIPLNEHFLALKNKFNNEKDMKQKEIQTEVRRGLILQVARNFEQMNMQEILSTGNLFYRTQPLNFLPFNIGSFGMTFYSQAMLLLSNRSIKKQSKRERKAMVTAEMKKRQDEQQKMMDRYVAVTFVLLMVYFNI